MKDMYDRHTTNRDVKVGDAVFVKKYVGHGPKWLPSALIECDSDVIVSETLDGRVMRPHMDHVRSRHSVTQPQSQPIVEEIPVPEIDSDSTPTTSDANRDIAVDTTIVNIPAPVEPTVANIPSTAETSPTPRRSTRIRVPVKRLNL